MITSMRTSKTYSWDLDLFRRLGFTPFVTDDQKELFVGQYRLDDHSNAKIKVWVTCMPAQFWRLEITTIEDKKFQLETGSGCLSEYWTTAMKFAEGMIVAKEL